MRAQSGSAYGARGKPGAHCRPLALRALRLPELLRNRSTGKDLCSETPEERADLKASGVKREIIRVVFRVYLGRLTFCQSPQVPDPQLKFPIHS